MGGEGGVSSFPLPGLALKHARQTDVSTFVSLCITETGSRIQFGFSAVLVLFSLLPPCKQYMVPVGKGRYPVSDLLLFASRRAQALLAIRQLHMFMFCGRTSGLSFKTKGSMAHVCK